jgi:CRISPR-associated protein Csd1
MILQRLNDLYDRLLENPDPVTGAARVPPYGFTDENISYCLVLSKAGELVDIQDVRDTSEKKPKAKLFSVPRPPKKSVNISPSFLWGNSQYVLGLSKKTFKNNETKDYFFAFREYINKVLLQTQDESLQALNKFLTWWEGSHFTSELLRPEQLDQNFIFKIDGSTPFIHQLPEAQRLWMHTVQDSESDIHRHQCLITGEANMSAARLHDGVSGGYLKNYSNKAEWTLVSFNKESFTSFRQDQGLCAPVSEQAAFAYTTALNYLLRRENGHCISIGDTSTVFWARAKSAQEESQAVSFFTAFANPPSDEGQVKKLSFSLEKIANGRPFQEVAPDLDPESRFYVLGLAPNAARLSIRYWLDSTLGELGQRLSEHWQDMQIEALPWRPEQPPSIWRCLIETAPLRKSENIAPQLAGEWLRSVLTGQRYPRALLTQIVQRLRTDGDLNGLRIALIKAVLQRDHRKGFLKEGIPMSLDLENAPLAYRLGCLFAVLAKAQSDAIPGANATIVDRYYSTASSVPYSVFPRLIAGFQNHLSKLRKGEDTKGWAVNHDRQLSNILATLPDSFPKHLSIEQQGQFAVGYYHQRQNFFIKKSDVPETESNPST